MEFRYCLCLRPYCHSERQTQSGQRLDHSSSGRLSRSPPNMPRLRTRQWLTWPENYKAFVYHFHRLCCEGFNVQSRKSKSMCPDLFFGLYLRMISGNLRKPSSDWRTRALPAAQTRPPNTSARNDGLRLKWPHAHIKYFVRAIRPKFQCWTHRTKRFVLLLFPNQMISAHDLRPHPETCIRRIQNSLLPWTATGGMPVSLK